jgi:L-fuconolactonase
VQRMLIDAHQHFWRLSERAGHWPPPQLAAIYRDFSPGDLAPLLQANKVRGTVLVQTLPRVAETDYLLDLAAANPFILGVVGWVDLAGADAAADIARLAKNPLLKGLRPMLQDLPDRHWIGNPALDAAIEAMLAHRLCFDALVLPCHLQPLLTFARRYPELPIVIDHAAKPLIADGGLEPWLSDMGQLAALPQVHCKLSGLLTEAGPDAGARALRPYVEAVLELFGAARVLWGSDWPVLRLASDYESWLAISETLLAGLSAAQRAAVFGRNAVRFYRLDVPSEDPCAAKILLEKS